MNFILTRIVSTNFGTFGKLHCDNETICNVLELKWRENQKGISAIPQGEYEVHYITRSASGKYRNVYYVGNVSKRNGILIHAGNFAGRCDLGYKTDSLGCLLPCKDFALIGNQIGGIASRQALNSIHKITQKQSFKLRIC